MISDVGEWGRNQNPPLPTPSEIGSGSALRASAIPGISLRQVLSTSLVIFVPEYKQSND